MITTSAQPSRPCAEDKQRPTERSGRLVIKTNRNPSTTKMSMRKNIKSKAVANGSHHVAETSELNAGVSDFIRKRAYELFEMRGRIPGQAIEDWLQAEQEIRARLQI